MKRNVILHVFFVVIFLAGMFILSASVEAAAPPPLTGVIIDWSAKTYVPAGFVGKVLPTAESPISAWILVFVNGKVADASQYNVRWYANDQLLRSGTGIVTASFKAPTAANQVVNLQARVQNPAGELTVANIQIPIVSPKVAIVGNYPGGTIIGSPANLTAIPYFFNVSGVDALTYQWTVNGTAAQSAENPQVATLNIGNDTPSGTTIAISLNVANPNDSTTATARASYVYQKI